MPVALFLLDTNVVIGLLQGKTTILDLLSPRGIALENCAVSQITRMELFSFPGILPAEEKRISALRAKLEVLMIDDDVEERAVKLRLRTRIKLPDAIIAATALAHNLELLTFDERLASSMKRSH